MPARSCCDYAVIRVVPRVEREEFINVGVILFCRTRRFLAAEVEVDEARLAALWPGLNLAEVREELAAIPVVCAGGAAAGPIGELGQAERWHWLVSPRSTVIQTSPAHAVISDDPPATLARLMRAMVRRESAPE
ncbi:MAG: DUF3037 domain-containing protein [Anaerolineae bacterium]